MSLEQWLNFFFPYKGEATFHRKQRLGQQPQKGSVLFSGSGLREESPVVLKLLTQTATRPVPAAREEILHNEFRQEQQQKLWSSCQK